MRVQARGGGALWKARGKGGGDKEKRVMGCTQGKKSDGEKEKRKCLRLQLGREKVEGRDIKFFFTKN